MSDIVITREEGAYRGELGGVDIFVPSRVIQLPGKPRLISNFWYAVMAYMAFYFGVYMYIRHGDNVDQVLGSFVLLGLMAPLILLGGGGAMRSRSRRGSFNASYHATQNIHLPDAGFTKGRTIPRPNQRLTLGQKSIRQVYEDNAMSRRNTPLRLVSGYQLDVRDDDGEDDGEFDTAAFWLVNAETNDEQLLLEKIARDEREVVSAAIHDALRALA